MILWRISTDLKTVIIKQLWIIHPKGDIIISQIKRVSRNKKKEK